jgi:hypothetical protein
MRLVKAPMRFCALPDQIEIRFVRPGIVLQEHQLDILAGFRALRPKHAA